MTRLPLGENPEHNSTSALGFRSESELAHLTVELLRWGIHGTAPRAFLAQALPAVVQTAEAEFAALARFEAAGIVSMEEAIVEEVTVSLRRVLGWWDSVERGGPAGAAAAAVWPGQGLVE
jgi:hypothetical protein